MNLETMLEMLDLTPSDVPPTPSPVNLYANFGPTPLARLFLNDKGYTLRFVGEKFSGGYHTSALDVLPSGGIRVKPIYKM